jgi:RNA polymerase sigma factor (sigma-70 family)
MKATTTGIDEVLKDIAGSNAETLEMVYRECYPPVQGWVLGNSGNYADAEDVFQDAITIVFLRASHGDLQLHSGTSICTLLKGIARKLWLQKLVTRKMGNALRQYKEEEIALPQTIENEINSLESEKMRICQKFFLQMNDKCRILMKLFMKGLKMKEIAEIMVFDSEDQVKMAKFRCKKDLADRILNDKEYQSLL